MSADLGAAEKCQALKDLKKKHEKERKILQSKQSDELQHLHKTEESSTSTTKQDKSKRKIIIYLQNASTDNHESNSLQHGDVGSDRNHYRMMIRRYGAVCPSLRSIQSVNVGRNDRLGHHMNISNDSNLETLQMAKQRGIKEKAVVTHKSMDYSDVTLKEPRLLITVVKPFGLRILRCVSEPAQITLNKYSKNFKTKQKNSSMKSQVAAVPRKKCVEHTDNRLENSENQILKEWLREKNKLLRKERRAKWKEKKAKQKEKKRQEKERQAKQEMSVELVREWMEKKRILISQKKGTTKEDTVLPTASKLSVSGISHHVSTTHGMAQKHNKKTQKTGLQRCTSASSVVANKISHGSEQLPSATINENHSLTSSSRKLGLHASTKPPCALGISRITEVCDKKAAQPLVLNTSRSKVSYKKQVLQGDTKTDKKCSHVLESSIASSKMSIVDKAIKNNAKLKAQEYKEEKHLPSNIILTKTTESTKVNPAREDTQNETPQAVQGQYKQNLSFEQWVQKKTDKQKKSKNTMKEKQIDSELQQIVPKMARRRIEAIQQNKKRVDTGISFKHSENFKSVNEVIRMPVTPKWVEQTRLAPTVVQRFMQRLQKDAIDSVNNDTVTSVSQTNNEPSEGSNPICAQPPLSNKQDSCRRGSEPVKIEDTATRMTADLAERPEPQGCESQESKTEKEPAN